MPSPQFSSRIRYQSNAWPKSGTWSHEDQICKARCGFIEILKAALAELGGLINVSLLNTIAILNPISAAARGAGAVGLRASETV